MSISDAEVAAMIAALPDNLEFQIRGERMETGGFCKCFKPHAFVQVYSVYVAPTNQYFQGKPLGNTEVVLSNCNPTFTTKVPFKKTLNTSNTFDFLFLDSEDGEHPKPICMPSNNFYFGEGRGTGRATLESILRQQPVKVQTSENSRRGNLCAREYSGTLHVSVGPASGGVTPAVVPRME